MYSYKERTTFEQRVAESHRIRDLYPGRIPIIVEISKNGSDLPDLDKHKYLVPTDLTMGQFVYVIRKRIKLAPEKALFVMTGQGVLPPTAKLIGQLYNDYVDEDGFLYLSVSGENTFGGATHLRPQ